MLKRKKFFIASITLGVVLFTSTIGQAANFGYSINQSFYDDYTQQNYNYNWQVVTIPNTSTRPSTPSVPVEPNKPVAPSTPVRPNEPVAPSTPVRPSEPVAPSTPVRPSEPVAPSTPIRPSEPVAPSTPVRPSEPAAPSTPNVPGLSQVEMEVVRLVNIERQKAGLSPFTASAELSRVARVKSEDMGKNNYFSHTSPTYGSPFEMMKSFGINYKTAGENIAKGYLNAQAVVNGWMNSPGHRANILNSSFNTLGVGAYTTGNGTIYWTQLFTN